jgi:hypothetical protein
VESTTHVVEGTPADDTATATGTPHAPTGAGSSTSNNTTAAQAALQHRGASNSGEIHKDSFAGDGKPRRASVLRFKLQLRKLFCF